MRPTAKKKWPIHASALAVAALAGCSSRDYTYPFFEFQLDTDEVYETDSDTQEPPDTETGTESESDTDTCPQVDTDDRCIRYVDWDAEESVCGTGWGSAFAKIQDGIDSAYEAAQELGSCDVWVAAGTYRSFEGDPLDTIVLRPHVNVYGGFAGSETELEQRDIAANETILDGRNFAETQSSFHVVMGSDNGLLDGFTITGGDATGDSPHHRGGGLYSNSANTTIRNCTFRGNRAVEGGAIFIYDAAPEVTRCGFDHNQAELGGAIFVLNGTAELADLRVEDNAASSRGGGVYLQSVFGNCQPTFERVTIRGNRTNLDGGGLYSENCSAEITTSKIEENTALRDGGGVFGLYGYLAIEDSTVDGNYAHGNGGGAACFDADLAFVDSEIARNAADGDGGGLHLVWSGSSLEAARVTANTAGGNGGGLAAELDSSRVVDSLITGNRAELGGGAFNGARAETTYLNTVLHGNLADKGGALYDADESAVEIVNTIAYGNDVLEIFDEKLSDTEVRFCDVRGGYPGSSNIDADPLFAAPGSWVGGDWTPGDYHLLPGSPCIDRANDAASPSEDADDNAWADVADAGLPDTSADIGAYDCQAD